jgi:hypothetical protein
VETSDLPERVGPVDRVVRDASGRIVRPNRSVLRAAIAEELERRGISPHQLWKEAQKHCPTIPESAVYEFLSGKRQIGLAYLDANFEAMDLTVTKRSRS